MSTINRIRTCQTTSTQVRIYGISRRVTTQGRKYWATRHSLAQPYTDGEGGSLLSREGYEVRNRLLVRPGITQLYFRNYEIQVTLAGVFDWDDVHSEIIEILKEVFFEETSDVEVQDVFASDAGECATLVVGTVLV